MTKSSAARKGVGRKSAGRPKIPTDKRKSDMLQLRCTPVLRKRVERVAALYDMGTAEFIRVVLSEACAANEGER